MATTEKKSVNVLCLDGGGVRGLSSLLVLRELLCRVNKKLNPTTHNGQPIHPSEVFDLIVGTSTGGLIALMMVKFNMSVDQCIEEYKRLSKQIFKKNLKHFIGKFSGGFGRVKKFSAKNLRKALLEHVIAPNLQDREIEAEAYLMEEVESHPKLMCSVVCREIYKTTKEPTPRTIFLCTHWDASKQDNPLICNACCRAKYASEHQEDKICVIDAARATSAAPTFFKHMELLGTLLVDGGFGQTNNPSLEAFIHYFPDPTEYQSIQMVNIGTGSQPDYNADYQPMKTKIDHIPYVRGLFRTTKSLVAMATESERVGGLMRNNTKWIPNGVLKFDRFSANRDNVHKIRLHQYKSIPKLEQITGDYLRDEVVDAQLDRLADEIAETCRQRRANLPTMSASALHEALAVLPPTELEPLAEPQPRVILESATPVTQGDRDNEVYLDQLVVPDNGPGLTDTSSCGSYEMPPTPRKRYRNIFRSRKQDA